MYSFSFTCLKILHEFAKLPIPNLKKSQVAIIYKSNYVLNWFRLKLYKHSSCYPPLFFHMHVICMTVLSTCPSFLEVFGVVVLSESHIERLRPSESETPLLLGPAGKIPLIPEEMAVQKAHQSAGVLPHFTTQLLESQVLDNASGVIQHLRITSDYSSMSLSRCVYLIWSKTPLCKLLQFIHLFTFTYYLHSNASLTII